MAAPTDADTALTRIAAFIAAIGLYLVLAVAVGGTWISGSPIRWPITGLVIVYAVVTGRLWRQIGYPLKAGISALVLLSAMALSAWWLGSVDAPGGFALMNLGAHTLAGAALVTGLGLAAGLLAGIPWLPRGGRVAAAAVAVYSALPFLVGIFRGASFGSVVTGGILPSWLPWWLQGPAMGIYLLLPLGVLSGIYRLVPLRMASSTQIRRWGFAGAAVALCFVLAVPDGMRRAGPDARASTTPASAGRNVATIPSASELRDALASARAFRPSPISSVRLPVVELIKRSDVLLDRLPFARYDLEARAASLPSDLGPSFAFVRDQIRFEPYPGTLRGAEGTLAAGAGNAADKALLLAALLKAKGFRTRFAMGRLARDRTDMLIARVFEPERPYAGPEAQPPAGDVDGLMLRVRARALRDFALIREALGTTLPSQVGPTRDQLFKEIERHVWVQVDEGGTWRDLDPAFADATPGKTYAEADRTADAMPQELTQRVTIRLVSESLAGTALHAQTALEFTALAPALVDRQIFLLFGRDPSLASGIAGGISGGEIWTPILWVDGQAHVGENVSFAYADRTGGNRGRGAPPRGGLGDVLGPGGALSSGSQFVALWLEFEITFPDGTRDVTRRTIVDRAGSAWRAAKPDPASLRALPRDAEGLLAPRTVHNVWLSAGRHDLSAFAIAARALAEMATMQIPDPPPPDLVFGELLWPFAMQNFGMLIYSDHVIVRGLNDAADQRFYADSPRIATISVGPDAGTGDDGIAVRIDLVRDHLRGVARTSDAERGIVERLVWFGAIEGALEHEFAARYSLGLGGDPAATRSTSGALDAGGVVLLRPGDGVPATSVDTAAGIAQSLAAGSVVIVPRRALQAGEKAWWEILPGGETRAVYEGAGGARSFGNGTRVGFNTISEQELNKLPGLDDMQKAFDRASAAKQARGSTPLKPNGTKGTKAKRSRGVPEYLAMIGIGTVLAFVVHRVIVRWVRHGTAQAANDTREAVQSGQNADRARR